MACTLLGPEGSAAGSDPGSVSSGLSACQVFLAGGEYRPYFENYTVDASILDSGPSGSGSQDHSVPAFWWVLEIIGQFCRRFRSMIVDFRIR